jgi:alkanesulfonate monooxygenase SsuD/methylene tetrahydromethanopterin reductase-like flavin-dependent oxidoreductase (luciferase family)
LRDFVGRAELAGLDEVWLWEDCFAEGGLTTAAAALAWTGSLRVGLGLMPVPLRNPALAAMEVATLARLFPGRFVPAVGHGILDWMGQVGARAASPMRLLREWTVAVRALLHGEKVTVAGEYVRLDGVQLGWPPAVVPPLLVGGRGPRTLALAGEIADGVVLDSGISPDGISPDGVARAIEQAGAPRNVVVYLTVAGADEAAPEVADLLGRYGEAGATSVVLHPGDADSDATALIELAATAKAHLR